MFDGTDFSCWKVRMGAYLDAVNQGVLRATIRGLPSIRDHWNPTPDESNYEKGNTRASNILLKSLTKEVYNQVGSASLAKEIWDKLVGIHMGSRDEREERHKVLMDKINAFKMLPHESANQMYSRLNVLIERLHDLDISKMKEIEIIRRFLGALNQDKYAIIVSILYNKNLTNYNMRKILGKIKGHKSLLGLVKYDDEAFSSSKKKDIALKATKEKEEEEGDCQGRVK